MWCTSVTRGRFCRVKLLLPSPAQSVSGPSSVRLRTILGCHIRYSHKLEGHVPVFKFPRTGWTSYNSSHRIPFLLPSTAHRATVEVIDPASTCANFHTSIWFTLYRLGTDHIENTASDNYSVFACVFVDVEERLPIHYSGVQPSYRNTYNGWHMLRWW
jgi:hypothetical protein